MSKVKIVKRSINTNSLFKDINQPIYDAITSIGVKWSNDSNRKAFIEVIEEVLQEKLEDGKIYQYKVMCDKRNNKSFSILQKYYLFEVHYKQTGCLNTSKIEYHINE